MTQRLSERPGWIQRGIAVVLALLGVIALGGMAYERVRDDTAQPFGVGEILLPIALVIAVMLFMWARARGTVTPMRQIDHRVGGAMFLGVGVVLLFIHRNVSWSFDSLWNVIVGLSFLFFAFSELRSGRRMRSGTGPIEEAVR
jgi:hypothetical protein